MASRRRIQLLLFAVTLVAALALPGRASASVHISFLSKRVTQGNQATLNVSVHPTAMCKLAVRYGAHVSQTGLSSVYAAKGKASWKWKVTGSAPAGKARVTVSCGRSGSASKNFLVVGWVVPARISVDKMGFSVRPNSYGAGSTVSYGVILRNTSPNQDALQVTALVNFVMADNHLIGSAGSTIAEIPAGSSYALGNQLNFPGAAPIVRLEVVLTIGGRGNKPMLQPAFDNMHFVPQLYDPGWLGSIEGEVVNAQAVYTMKSVSVSAVVMDRSGAVIGGGNGFAFGTLPPGAREVLIVNNGLSAIPFTSASDMMLSAVGSYDVTPPSG